MEKPGEKKCWRDTNLFIFCAIKSIKSSFWELLYVWLCYLLFLKAVTQHSTFFPAVRQTLKSWMVGFLSLYDTKHLSHISIFLIWENEEKKKKASTCKLPIHTLSSSDWTKKCKVSQKGSKKMSLVLMKIFEEFGQRMQRASEINSAWWWWWWWACMLFFISSQWLIKHQLQEAESDRWDCDLTLERPRCCAYHRQHASLLTA